MVSLQKLKAENAAELANLANNIHIWNTVRDAFPHPYTIKNAEEFLGWVDKDYNFGIWVDGQFAGVISLVPQADVASISAEVGYWLGEPFWGRGIMTEALKQIVQMGFEQKGFQKLFAIVFEGNEASKRVLQKAGFQLEGHFKKAMVKNGLTLDQYYFGLCKD